MSDRVLKTYSKDRMRLGKKTRRWQEMGLRCG